MTTERDNQILLVRNIFSNVGDEAMLCCEIDEIVRKFPDYRLKVLTDDPHRIRKIYGVETDYSDTVLTTPFARPERRVVHQNLLTNDGSLVNGLHKRVSDLTTKFLLPWMCGRFVRSSASATGSDRRTSLPAHQRNLLENLKTARIVIGGGGLIPSIKGIFYSKIALYGALAELGIPYILHGQTVLPESGAERVYQNAFRVLLRDRDRSKRTAIGFGADPARLIEKTDPAFDLPADDSAIPAGILEFMRKPFLAVNLRNWKSKNFESPFFHLATALKAFHRINPEMRLLFFPMQEYGPDNDLTALNAIRNQLDSGIETATLSADIRPAAFKAVLARAFAAITSRYHGAVFALSAGIPTLGISVSSEYDVKLNGIFEMMGAQDFLLSAESLETNDLVDRLKLIAGSRSSIVSSLKQARLKLDGLPGLAQILAAALDEPNFKRSYARN